MTITTLYNPVTEKDRLQPHSRTYQRRSYRKLATQIATPPLSRNRPETALARLFFLAEPPMYTNARNAGTCPRLGGTTLAPLC